MAPLKNINPKTAYWFILTVCHLVLLFFLYRSFGFNILNEGDKYLSEASYLTQGNYLKAFEHQHFYAVYIVYLSLFLFLKLPAYAIFISTYLLSLFSYFLFYKSLKELISPMAARTWLALMLLSPMLQFWQFNLFSETFFIALSLIFTSIALKKSSRHRSIKLLLLALMIIFSRPSGIFIVAALYCYLKWPDIASLKKAAGITGVLLTCFFAGFLFLVPLHYRGVSYEIASGAIYCGVPTLTPTTLQPGNYTLANCYSAFIHDNSLTSFFVVFIKKIASFFVLMRPHYSLLHNCINGAHILFYFFAITGIYLTVKQKKVARAFFITLLVVIIMNVLMVGLTFNEWTERYTVQVFPYIFVLSCYPLSLILIKIKNRLAF